MRDFFSALGVAEACGVWRVHRVRTGRIVTGCRVVRSVGGGGTRSVVSAYSFSRYTRSIDVR
eukprot:6089078-Prymnesium_polylepis.1